MIHPSPYTALEAAFGVAVNTTPTDSQFVDLTQYVDSLEWDRGRHVILNYFEAGWIRAHLDNHDRRFEPEYAAGAYFPNVDQDVRVRVRQWWNLLSANQSGVTTDTSGFNSAGTSTLARVTTPVPATGATAALRMTAAGGNMFCNLLYGVDQAESPWDDTKGQPADPGVIYSGHASFQAAATPRSCRVDLQFNDAAGAQISVVTGATVTDNTSSYTQTITTSGKAPAGTVYVQMTVWVLSAAASEIHYVSNMGIYDSLPSGQSVWTLGGPYVRVTAFADGWKTSYPNVGEAFCELNATDRFKYLNRRGLRVPYVMEVLRDKPTAYYRTLEATGATVALDSSGNGNSATYAGTFVFGGTDPITDATDHAITFDGSTSEIRAPLNTVSGNTAISLEAWVKTSSTASQFIVSASTNVIAYGAVPTLFVHVGGLATFRVPGAADASGASVSDGVWHHVVGTRDVAGNCICYVDGVAGTTQTGATGTVAAPYLFGQGGGDPTNQHLNGQATDIAVYHGVVLSGARVLAHYNARNAWINDFTGVRVNHVLDTMQHPSAERDVASGQTVLQSSPEMDGQTMLQQLQGCETSENGALFVKANGSIKFRDRQAILKSPYTVSQGTFGNTASNIMYESIVMDFNDQMLRNDVVIKKVNGTSQTATDAASVLRRGTFTLTRTVMTTSDSENNDAANWFLTHFSSPIYYPQSMVMNPMVSPGTIFQQLLQRELEDRVTITFQPPGGGAAFTKDCHIQHWNEKITPDSYTVTWEMSPADAQVYMILNDTSSGLLDTGRLGY